MSPIPDAGLCLYGSQVLLNHLTALESEMEGVRTAGADIEHIHRMRVATRRLRATLPLFSACFNIAPTQSILAIRAKPEGKRPA